MSARGVPRAALPLWRGRVLAYLGILLTAGALRVAVASLSPVFTFIARDFPLPSGVIGLIGAAPPVCFALFGLFTPRLVRRLGIETVAVIALVTTTLGLLSRGFADGALTLLLATALTFAGVGMGNILLPPLVKKYFPDRIGLMVTLYTTVMSFATFLPPLLVVPIAETAGWRISLALWAAFGVAALLPWLAMLLRERGARTAEPSAEEEPVRGGRGTSARLLRLPLAWALAATFGTSGVVAYVSFAWLPTILVEHAGASAHASGVLLSLFAATGVPGALLAPMLVVRFRATRAIVLFSSLSGVVGVLGLLLFPEPALLWLWVIFLGLTCTVFPLSFVLVGLLSRYQETSVELSGFMQTIGYTCAALSPVLVGVLHGATGSWIVPLFALLAVAVVIVPVGFVISRPHTVEDEWERRSGRSW